MERFAAERQSAGELASRHPHLVITFDTSAREPHSLPIWGVITLSVKAGQLQAEG
jgi:hypothetical protein